MDLHNRHLNLSPMQPKLNTYITQHRFISFISPAPGLVILLIVCYIQIHSSRKSKQELYGTVVPILKDIVIIYDEDLDCQLEVHNDTTYCFTVAIVSFSLFRSVYALE